MNEIIVAASEVWKNSEKLKAVLTPTILEGLTQEPMEELLGMLPQVGAIKDREPGRLRIVSMGWHAHIQGTDKKCPFPVDFFVRVNGILSAINLVVRLPQQHLTDSLFGDRQVGATLDLFDALSLLNQSRLGLKDLELVQQLMYRPAVPNGFHWSTPGGVQASTEQTTTRALRELAQEAEGLKLIASAPLMTRRAYQEGNIPEFHSGNGVLCIGEPKLSERAKSEGIQEYLAMPLLSAVHWFETQCSVDLDSPTCNVPGGKTEHMLLRLLYQCQKRGIQ